MQITSEPQPVRSCQSCMGIARKRAEKRAANDQSAVSDCNVLLRRHLSEKHADAVVMEAAE